jgi:hypothetical protein
MRELVTAKGDDFLCARLGTQLKLHKGAGSFAPLLIGPRYDGRKLHCRMLVERDFDLDARNILTA